jgi:hypothetical protein
MSDSPLRLPLEGGEARETNVACAWRLLLVAALLMTTGGVQQAVAADAGLLMGPAAVLLLRSPRSSLIELAQSRPQTQPVINVATMVLAEPASDTPFPIQVGPPDAIPKNSFLRVRGLPASVALSEGHSIAPGSWAVPFVGLPTLRISVPVGLSGKSEITVALVTVDGAVLADVRTTLLIASPSLVAPGQSEPQPKSVASIGAAVATAPVDSSNRGARSTRPSAPAAPPRTEAQQHAMRFVTKGNELLGEGDVSTARLYYQRAADAGLHEGALAMAATYDPDELIRIGVKGLQPDPKAARSWYEKARDLGAPEAEERLRRLSAR